MSLIKRPGIDFEWPHLFASRRWTEWPDAFAELAERSEIKLEEFRDDGVFVIRAEIPGVDPDRDVEIVATSHALRISVERREESESMDKEGYRSEFCYGSFMRSVPLPRGATSDDVTATYADGVLEIRVPVVDTDNGAKKVSIRRT